MPVATVAAEELGILIWQMGHLLELGFSLPEAEALTAACTSWHEVADLVAAGCPRELALGILL